MLIPKINSAKKKDRKEAICGKRQVASCSLLVPPDKLLQPCLQICGGLIAKLPLGKSYVCVSKLNISIPWHLQHNSISLHFQQPLQYTHKLGDRHWRCISQIENPQLRRPLLLPTTSSALLCRIQ
ncbi:hypothetical protein AQUCO_01300641v1 [Aquilegia coerulea]|uniref:Uncharacterized protein n=1 Tax=Aquilegia coerulea TaxID=218851 RepID=A0A2G5E2V5_AQUCA|nr:hypothetical protein AQUCO_01300641v1 [Aquilegia coerulea]